jgi:hypothetical protein
MECRCENMSEKVLVLCEVCDEQKYEELLDAKQENYVKIPCRGCERKGNYEYPLWRE